MKLFAEINKAKEEHNVQEEEDMCHSKPAKRHQGVLWIYQTGNTSDIVSYRQTRVAHRWWSGLWPNRMA
jgi:hypothetical protein